MLLNVSFYENCYSDLIKKTTINKHNVCELITKNELIYYAEFGLSYMFGELSRTEEDYISVTSENFFRNLNEILSRLGLNCSYVIYANLNNFNDN